ncbi:MAG: hypothetical protein MJZ30_09460 [Paludibacteraceae bacterium]|nr:hypothetical protein [Paludibacteraceae bacterium]
MAKFKITLSIDADSAEQAKKIAQNLQATAKKVKGSELEKMFALLNNNPQWIDMAKKFV